VRIYYGQVGWGWKMYGIGYRNEWFLGYSRRSTKMTMEELLEGTTPARGNQ